MKKIWLFTLIILMVSWAFVGFANSQVGSGSLGLIERVGKLESTIEGEVLLRVTSLESKQKELEAVLAESILMTTKACSELAGNWVEVSKTQGRFLLGTSSVYKPGTTGGKSKVTLGKENIPRHTHQLPVDAVPTGKSQQSLIRTKGKDEGIHSSQRRTNSGSGNGLPARTLPHENMPPYYVVHHCQLKL